MTGNLPSDASGSERVGGFLSRLHPVTRALVWIAALHLAATLATVGGGLVHPTGSELAMSLGERLAVNARAIAYSLQFFGSAATVEFLFRIWTELKLGRTDDGKR